MGYIGSHIHQIRESGWGQKPLLYPGVHCLIFNEAGELLMGYREDLGGWSSVGGGCMEINESVEQLLKREVEEETGRKVATFFPFGIMSDPAKSTVRYKHGDVMHCVTTAMTVTLDGPPGGGVDADEHRDMAFYPLEKLPQPLHSVTAEIIKLYQQWKATGQFQLS